MTDDAVDRAWALVRKAGREVEPRRHLRDLLLARGDALGEFLDLVLTPDDVVRAQNDADERAGTPLKTMRARHARADELLRLHGATWFPYPPWDKSRWKRDWSTFLGRGMPDAAAVFSFGPPQLEVLEWTSARFPLRHVSFRDVDPADGLRFLDERGLLPCLGSLDLVECTFSDATVDVLAGAAAGLEGLQLSRPRGLEGDRAARFFGARAFSSLKHIGVASTTLEPAALRALWAVASSLDELRLHEVVLGAGSLGPLSSLAVERVTIEARLADRQLIEMLGGLRLASLRTLTLRVKGSLKGFFKFLAERAKRGELDALTVLDLEHNHINDDQVRMFLAAPPPNLSALVLSNNSIGLKGLEALCAWAKSTTTLRRLGISTFIGSGVWEEGTDWDGTVVGAFERGLTVEEIRDRFGFPKHLKLQ